MALCLLCYSLEEEEREEATVVFFPLAFLGGEGKVLLPQGDADEIPS